MALSHGKNTVVKVATKDLSQYTDSSELQQKPDAHDVTTYGNQGHRKGGGLSDGTFKMSGVYDSTALTGPRAVLQPAQGTVVPVIRQPEGTGVGKPQDAFNALLTSYTETNPVADFIRWSAEFEIDGTVNSAVQ